MEKHYISGDTLLLDSFRLAAMIHRSGFRPDLIVGVWRGGTPVAIAVHEYFAYLGITADHIPVRASSYTGIDQQDPEVRLHGLDYVIEQSRPDQQLLIVDDVFDSGLSVEAVITALTRQAGRRAPATMKTAMPWYKPARNRTGRAPDYYLHETDQWLVFPHELCGLSVDEIQRHKGPMAETLVRK